MKYWGLLLLGLLAGCAGRPEPQIYVLGTATEPAAGVRDDAGRRVIEVRPVLIPDYLDTTDMLLRTGDNQLRASETGIWGERLSAGITRALAAALARRIPEALVVTRPPAARAPLRVLVEVTALEARAGGDCALTAHWTLVSRGDTGGSAVPATAQASFVTHADGPGDGAVVAALSRAIGQLADQIAARAAMNEDRKLATPPWRR